MYSKTKSRFIKQKLLEISDLEAIISFIEKSGKPEVTIVNKEGRKIYKKSSNKNHPLLTLEQQVLEYLNKINFPVPNLLESNSNYMVIESVGKTLADLFLYKRISFIEKEKIFHAFQIVALVYALSKKGIYHCDLKPENICLKEGKIYLIDFGSSLIFNRELLDLLSQKMDKKLLSQVMKLNKNTISQYYFTEWFFHEMKSSSLTSIEYIECCKLGLTLYSLLTGLRPNNKKYHLLSDNIFKGDGKLLEGLRQLIHISIQEPNDQYYFKKKFLENFDYSKEKKEYRLSLRPLEFFYVSFVDILYKHKQLSSIVKN